MKRFSFIIASATVLALGSSCGKKKNRGSSLAMGQLFLPVKESAPVGLASGSAAGFGLTGESNFTATLAELSTLKSRLFSPGPTDFMDRVKKVDDRLKELDQRQQESARKCVGEEPKEWKLTGLPDSQGGLTGSTSFWLQCSETVNVSNVSPTAKLTIYFGRKDGFSYLAELSSDTEKSDPPTLAVLGKVDDASTKSEIWQVMLTSENEATTSKKHSMWMYILADKLSKNFEMSVGGTGKLAADPSQSEGPFSGVGCGVKVKASATHVYGIGRFHESGPGGGNAGLPGETCDDAERTICASAIDLSSKSDNDCSSLNNFNVSVPKLTFVQLGGNNETKTGYTLGSQIVKAAGMPSLSSFSEESVK